MKRSLLIIFIVSFHNSFAWAGYGSRQTPQGLSVGERNQAGDVIETSSLDICVNHRVTAKGESFTTARAWCSQHLKVEHVVPPADDSQGSTSDVSI